MTLILWYIVARRDSKGTLPRLQGIYGLIFPGSENTRFKGMIITAHGKRLPGSNIGGEHCISEAKVLNSKQRLSWRLDRSVGSCPPLPDEGTFLELCFLLSCSYFGIRTMCLGRVSAKMSRCQMNGRYDKRMRGSRRLLNRVLYHRLSLEY